MWLAMEHQRALRRRALHLEAQERRTEEVAALHEIHAAREREEEARCRAEDVRRVLFVGEDTPEELKAANLQRELQRQAAVIGRLRRERDDLNAERDELKVVVLALKADANKARKADVELIIMMAFFVVNFVFVCVALGFMADRRVRGL